MELKALVGEHLLDAVDFSNVQVKTWGDQFEPCQVIRFRLDGMVYIAVEDPEDGYRSHMKDLTVSAYATMENVFAPVKVVGRHREQGRCGDNDDVLELIAADTGKVVLEVGTENSDDYYPLFVAAFYPGTLALSTV